MSLPNADARTSTALSIPRIIEPPQYPSTSLSNLTRDSICCVCKKTVVAQEVAREELSKDSVWRNHLDSQLRTVPADPFLLFYHKRHEQDPDTLTQYIRDRQTELTKNAFSRDNEGEATRSGGSPTRGGNSPEILPSLPSSPAPNQSCRSGASSRDDMPAVDLSNFSGTNSAEGSLTEQGQGGVPSGTAQEEKQEKQSSGVWTNPDVSISADWYLTQPQ